MGNILLLAMSILATNKESEVAERNYVYMDEKGTDKEYTGYGQQECVPKMLFDEYGPLDKYIILATQDTQKPITFIHRDVEKRMSAVEFFKQQINDYFGNKCRAYVKCWRCVDFVEGKING